jgi:hypothetical protein
MITPLAQATLESFSWNHFATLTTMALALISLGVSLWSNRKTDLQVAQSEGCKYDHEGIRGILVTQGAALAESVRQQGRQVDAFSTLAHSMEMNHKDVMQHHRDVARVLAEISDKLEK